MHHTRTLAAVLTMIMCACGGSSGSSADEDASDEQGESGGDTDAASDTDTTTDTDVGGDHDVPALCPATGVTTLVPEGTWPACPAASYTKVATNQAYASGNAAFVLDVYRPNTGLAAYPTVIWIHGGGWESGSKNSVNQVSWLLCEGYAVASVEYRLTSDATTGDELEPPQPFPAQIHDVKAAIRYLKANATTYQLDPERFATFGSSAGGHLSALAATSGGVSELEDLTMGSGTASSRVRAAVDWFGPTWFSSMDQEILALSEQAICNEGQATHGQRTSGESKLCGCAVSDASCASEVAAASPVTYVDANDPPMLLMHGDRDCISPNPQSARLYEALSNAQACAQFVTVTGAGHSNDTASWLSASVRQKVLDFLNAALTATVRESEPHGIYALDAQTGVCRDNRIGTYDGIVDGYVWRYGWEEIETSAGHYDFDCIDSVVGQLAALNLKLSWILRANVPPPHVLAASETWTAADGEKPLPWDPTTIASFQAFLEAMASHEVADPARGGALVPLAQHSVLYAVSLGFPGLPSGAIRDMEDAIVDIPGYSRAKLIDTALLPELATARDAFPDKHLHVGMWAVADDAETGELWDAITDAIVNAFDGLTKPRVGLFMDNLASSRPSLDGEVTGYPLTTFALPEAAYMDTTYVAFQMLTSYDAPFTGPDKVANSTPMDGMQYASDTYGSRYFELYVPDLERADWRDQLLAWAATLAQ